MTQNAPLYKIISGPSKFDFMLALFNEIESQPMVRFGVECNRMEGTGYRLGQFATISSVKREGGSPDSWIFEGKMHVIFDIPVPATVKGHYSTQTRTGTIEVLELHFPRD